MNDIDFCSEESEIFDSVVEICTTCITSLNKRDVLRMYRSWKQGFFDIENSEDFVRCKSVIAKDFLLPSALSYLGIDFPTWLNFKYSKEIRRRIMIVGIDPLRDDENPAQVSIGTPYALHHKKMRDGRTGEYWKFIQSLAADYSIYMTDIFKVFFYSGSGKTNRSYRNRNFTTNALHQEILAKEIKIVKPDIIITMGNIATKLVLDDRKQRFSPISKRNIFEKKGVTHRSNTEIIPMVHLSGSSRKGQKIFIETNYKLAKVGSNGHLYSEIIKTYLDAREVCKACEGEAD